MRIGRETKIGIFAAVTLAATFLVINYLRGEDLFHRNMEICSHYENLEGLMVSNPVYVKGYKAGTVSAISYNPETGQFDVTCSVTKKISIPADTKMTIYSVDLMGGKGIRLNLGTSEEMVEDEGELEPAYSPDMVSSLTNVIGPLLVKVSSLLDTLEATLVSADRALSGVDEKALKSAINHADKALANVESLTGMLDGRNAEIDSIIINMKDISGRLTSASEKADSAMTGIVTLSNSLSESDIDGLISSLKSVVEKLGNPDGTFGKLMEDGEVYESFQQVLKDLDSLVKKIEENPKKYVRIKLL